MPGSPVMNWISLAVILLITACLALDRKRASPSTSVLCGSLSWRSDTGSPKLASWRRPEENCQMDGQSVTSKRNTVPCTFPASMT